MLGRKPGRLSLMFYPGMRTSENERSSGPNAKYNIEISRQIGLVLMKYLIERISSRCVPHPQPSVVLLLIIMIRSDTGLMLTVEEQIERNHFSSLPPLVHPRLVAHLALLKPHTDQSSLPRTTKLVLSLKPTSMSRSFAKFC